MRVLLFLIFGLGFIRALTPPENIDALLLTLNQTFADEFDTFSVWNSTSNTGIWQTSYPWGGRTNNNEFQYYSDITVGVDPFILSNGILRIEAKPGVNLPKGPDGRTLNYTSGIITSNPSFNQQFGYFEIDTQLPYGAGMWPAFWLLPSDWSWPPEIDILEAFGAPNWDSGYNNQYHYALHDKNSSLGYGDWVTVPANITTGFHRYGCLWTNESISFYFDGNKTFQGPTYADVNQPMYILANLAVGGSWPGSPNAQTPVPAYMDINYIRVWSLEVVSTTTGSTDGSTTADMSSSSTTEDGGAVGTTGDNSGVDRIGVPGILLLIVLFLLK